MRLWLAIVAICSLGLALVPGCGESGPGAETGSGSGAEGDSKVVVACTIGMVADTVRHVVGDRAEVVGLIKPGVDPHLYAATRADVKSLLESDVIFYNGHFLEGKMVEAIEGASESGIPVHAIAESLSESVILEEAAGVPDPHVWMDPSAWSATIEVVRDAMIAFDPEGEGVYTANAEAYAEALAALDAYAERVLASVPESARVLVTAHDAFNYFGHRYGYEVMGIQGLSTESEAGVRDIERISGILVERGVGAVFVESTVPERSVNALINSAKAAGHDVVIGGELFSDAMGDDGTYEGTYVGMIDHNVTTIARALGGDAPEAGMSGKLTP
ncbi:MAG: zinc ABC transporter substrate-binding protein [Planctomycetota bacterium]